jgi:predicted deacylase
MDRTTMIFTDVDYNRDGKQVDWLHLPHSVTRSAYGTIAMPIAVVKSGPGPTVLLMSGNHGDEYEGQIALAKLIRTLEPEQIKGRVIILPAANFPAAMAGERVSPIDGGNLNRAFPGNADGTPTFAISHYIDSVLFPMADYFHDLHSGGSSLEYLPFCSMRLSNDKALDDKALAALNAFNAPLGLVWAYSPDQRLSAVASLKRGIVSLGGEFGGSGRVSIAGVATVERGVRRLLAHAGVLAEPVPADGGKPTRLVELKGRDYYVYAPEPGLFEPFVELGADVKKGDPCGQVHFIDNPARAPVPCFFRTSGMVICKRHPGRVERGDCVAHLATDVRG